MTPLDREVFAERAAAVQRHLARVADRLPDSPAEFEAATDASDAVILHLWQATQIVIDLATAACVRQGLGTPSTYADAFARLAGAGLIDDPLAERLARAAGFRNLVAHAYERLDMLRVHEAARSGPSNQHAFLVALRDCV